MAKLRARSHHSGVLERIVKNSVDDTKGGSWGQSNNHSIPMFRRLPLHQRLLRNLSKASRGFRFLIFHLTGSAAGYSIQYPVERDLRLDGTGFAP